MKDFEGCETTSTDPNIVVSDTHNQNSRSRFRLHNPTKLSIKIVRVDDCVIREGIRCDYLILTPNGEEMYVELKGSDVRHAVKQIARSIDLLTCTCQPVPKKCFIASTRCPINSTEIQNLKKKFRRQYNAELVIKNGEIDYKYDSASR